MFRSFDDLAFDDVRKRGIQLGAQRDGCPCFQHGMAEYTDLGELKQACDCPATPCILLLVLF